MYVNEVSPSMTDNQTIGDKSMMKKCSELLFESVLPFLHYLRREVWSNCNNLEVITKLVVINCQCKCTQIVDCICENEMSTPIYTGLFKINRTHSFFFCIDLPFGRNSIYPIYGIPCKFGKAIFNIKAGM